MVDLFEKQCVIASRDVFNEQRAALDAGRCGEVRMVIVLAELKKGVDLRRFATFWITGEMDADAFPYGCV